jgi:superfamily II DNA or RNA helicase
MPVKVVLKKLNESFFQVVSDDRKVLKSIYKCLEVFIEGSQFSPRYQQGIWDGKISFLDRRNNFFPFGLWLKVIEHLKKEKIEYEIQGTTIKELTTNSFFDPKFIQDFEDKVMQKTMPFRMREYQMQALIKSLQVKKAIALMCTGSGKSALIHYTMQILKRTQEAKKILVVVPNISLVTQLFSNIRDDYNFPKIEEQAYLLYGGTPNKEKQKIKSNDMDRPFLITTYQSIMRLPAKWFQQFDALLIDEVHGVSSSAASLKKISQYCINAKYKLGYTGTLGDNEADKLTTIGYVGPVCYTLKSKTLIDLGFLSTIEIKNYFLRYPEEFSAEVKGLSYQAEVAKINKYEPRNKIFKYIIDEIPEGENVLVLARFINHIDMLEEYFKENFPDATIHRIDGGVDGEVREEIRLDITNSDDKTTHILLASYATVAVGVNIPNLHHIVFAASSKGKIKVLQAIGRGLRKAKGKSNMILHDIIDDMCDRYSTGRRYKKNKVYKHFEKRKEYYEKEGFEQVDIEIDLDQL